MLIQLLRGPLQVLDEIGIDTASMMKAAPKRRLAVPPAAAAERQSEDVAQRMAALRQQQ